MFGNRTDKNWNKFGKEDAYYGVLSHDMFRNSNLSDKTKTEFFNTGHKYIDGILKKIKKQIDPDFKINNAIDFGCGVGRLTIPLAKTAHNVTAIDVSEFMLLELKKNCATHRITNVSPLKSDDNLSLLKGSHNFIHSYIVFQHIPVSRGKRMFHKLLNVLEAGGIGVIHFTYASHNRQKKTLSCIKKWIPFSANTINLIKGRRFSEPQMQMNEYNLKHIFLSLQNSNISDCHIEFTNHGGELGVVLYFQKPKNP